MLKRLHEMTSADARFASLAIVDPDDGSIRAMRVEDHYAALGTIELSPQVPSAVNVVFERARNAFLYAWFAYDLTALAEGQAYAALEMALRDHLNGGSKTRLLRGISEQLNAVCLNGTLDDFAPSEHTSDADRKAYFEQLTTQIARSRNHLAHGTESIGTPGAVLDSLRLCANLINHLYRRSREPYLITKSLVEMNSRVDPPFTHKQTKSFNRR
ncbi:MAG: hypothetical protein ABL864_04100 [Terricaulis sp.]